MVDRFEASVPFLGFAARSGTGKTTLLKKLIPALRSNGLRIGLVKHAHHNFDVDTPGKDSYELRKAGSTQVLVASSVRWVLIDERDQPEEPTLQDLLDRMVQRELDLILVEGFKHEAFPKIELFRPALGQPPLFPRDRNIIAVATDGTLPETTALPVLDINAPDQIAEYILRWIRSCQD
ncbi:MAG: molybdopterin-guanine dinucleotide biosynthesis protein MobB [Pseudomonadota bacterium]|nr:molybdopterin-guanine dinucleotide biosynthesis protein MobB [Pseudomonadota bacterium]